MSVLPCCALLSVAEGQALHSMGASRVDAQHKARLRSHVVNPTMGYKVTAELKGRSHYIYCHCFIMYFKSVILFCIHDCINMW